MSTRTPCSPGLVGTVCRRQCSSSARSSRSSGLSGHHANISDALWLQRTIALELITLHPSTMARADVATHAHRTLHIARVDRSASSQGQVSVEITPSTMLSGFWFFWIRVIDEPNGRRSGVSTVSRCRGRVNSCPGTTSPPAHAASDAGIISDSSPSCISLCKIAIPCARSFEAQRSPRTR